MTDLPRIPQPSAAAARQRIVQLRAGQLLVLRDVMTFIDRAREVFDSAHKCLEATEVEIASLHSEAETRSAL